MSKPFLTIVVAAGANDFAIGQEGHIPWHLPGDLRRFKLVTMKAGSVVMGRRTALSLPKPLPERVNYVVTSGADIPGFITVRSLDEAIDRTTTGELAVCGGTQLYKEALLTARFLDLTLVHGEFPRADTFFEGFDTKGWRLLGGQTHESDVKNEYARTSQLWERRAWLLEQPDVTAKDLADDAELDRIFGTGSS